MPNTTYRLNSEHNGIEIIFDGKPEDVVREQLKNNGFRWHRQKKLWYAKQTDERLALAERFAEGKTEQDYSDWSGECSEGYMGAIRWDGNKSGKYLYGSDLSKAIREDLKAHGIKGCSVSVKTYSMGQSIRVKVKCTESDFVPFEEWVKGKSIHHFEDGYGHIYVSKGNRGWISTEKYWELDENGQAELFEDNARRCYKGQRINTLNHYYLERYDTFTDKFMQKIKNIDACIRSYRYDDSNGMVDYFDTNFYYDIELKEVE